MSTSVEIYSSNSNVKTLNIKHFIERITNFSVYVKMNSNKYFLYVDSSNKEDSETIIKTYLTSFC